MTTKISSDNIQEATLATLGGGGGGPKISSVVVTNSSYTNLDDTAVSLDGGYVKLIGSGFAAGCQVLVGLTPATSVTYISATEVRAQLPATAAGTYIIYLVNSDGGTAIRINAVTFSGTPTWISDSTLDGAADVAISIQLAASGASTFGLAPGSSLPAGVTLSSSGLLSGTVTGIQEQTVYNFVINAIDAELQDSPRSFAFTVTAGDQYFRSTTLLLSGSANTFVKDASTNNFAVAITGDTKPTNFNPHLTGWSNYFDGAGDYLTADANAAFDFGTGDFTIEAWVYPINNGQFHPTFLGSVTGWSAGASGHRFNNTNYPNKFWFGLNGGGGVAAGDPFMVSANTFSFETWHHYAVTRSGNTFKMFVNGVLENTQTFSGSYNVGLGGLRSGWSTWDGANGYFTGSLSNLRIVKGTAVYTTNFTPSTQALTAISGTSLLTYQSNRIVDNSTNAFALTRSGDVAVRSFSPFVEPTTTRGSGYFEGSGDFLTLPANNNFATSTGDFTIEGWIYVTNLSDTRCICGTRTAADTTTGWNLSVLTNGSIQMWDNTAYANTGAGSVVVNTWYHFAFVRQSNVVYSYVNGIQKASTASTRDWTQNTFWIGANGGSTEPFSGYISNIRLVKGTAVYTTAFTPPTVPLTAVSNTSLLTLQNNTPVANNTFLDSSLNNLLINRAGNATQGTFSPYSASGWSNYFDGGSNRLTTAGSGIFNLTATSFTLECWVYMTAAPSVYNRFITIGPNNAQSSLLLGIGTDRVLAVAVPFSSGGGVDSGANLVPLNAWTHLAFVLSGSTGTLYINGTQVGQTSSWNITSSDSNYFYIGYDATGTVDGKFTGYVSNVRLVRGTAVYTGAFTPATQPLTAVSGTAILTCCDNRVVDDSPNRFALGTTGSVQVQNFSPFKAVVQTPATYSAYFDGTGDYLQTPSSSLLGFGTSDFTTEMWVYSGANGTGTRLGGNGTGGNWASGNWIIATSTSSQPNKFVLAINNNTASPEILVSTSIFNNNQWMHVAITRLGNSWAMFVNGVREATATSSVSVDGGGSRSITLGQSNISGDSMWAGYISNFRVVIGTAVYSPSATTITVPTTPLTAISGTQLLICQSATFIDNSTNNFTITASGNTQPTTINPLGSSFGNYLGYTAAGYGGSMRFDGAGDYLAIPNPTAFAFGANNFTIELWVYIGDTNARKYILGPGTDTPSHLKGFGLEIWGQQLSMWASSNGTGWNMLESDTAGNRGSTLLAANTWHHIAVTRSGDTFRSFVNGTVEKTFTVSGSIFHDPTIPYNIGRVAAGGGDFYYNGYMSNLRITRGQAIYTNNFVPPVAPVQPVANTVLLLNSTSAGIVDVTTKNDIETAGDVRVSTAVSKFGGSSMYFDGTGDYLSIPRNSILDPGAGDFTYECWLYLSGTQRASIIGSGSAGNVFTTWIDYNSTGSGKLGIWASSNGSSWNMINADVGGNGVGTTTLSTETWYHVAYTRSGNVFRLFLNGSLEVSVTVAGAIAASNSSWEIGRQGIYGHTLLGYIQDFRITKGHARYTANFTAPVTQLLQR